MKSLTRLEEENMQMFILELILQMEAKSLLKYSSQLKRKKLEEKLKSLIW